MAEQEQLPGLPSGFTVGRGNWSVTLAQDGIAVAWAEQHPDDHWLFGFAEEPANEVEIVRMLLAALRAQAGTLPEFSEADVGEAFQGHGGHFCADCAQRAEMFVARLRAQRGGTGSHREEHHG